MLAWWGPRRQQVWDGSDMPSQEGKIAIVTGANSGIGFEAAKRLAARGATVVLACRSETRGQEAAACITQRLQQLNNGKQDAQQPLLQRDNCAVGSVEVMQVDMGELASIVRFAARFRERFDRLDLLINNAGVSLPVQRRTADGFESQFGINHIGAFALTRLLFDLLAKAPAARIVAVSSIAHRSANLNYAPLARGENSRPFADFPSYANSKMANLLFTYELDRRLRRAAAARGQQSSSIKAVAAHPGLTQTAIFARFIEDVLPRVLQWLLLPILFALPFNTVEVGVLPILYVATVKDVDSGAYYGPDRFGNRVGYPTRETSTPASHSEEAAKKLWALSEELVGGRFDVE